jgi:proline iminopeptidase
MPRDGYAQTADGLRLCYRAVGSGGRIVLVPNGFHMLDAFGPLARARTIVFYDVRSRGLSDAATNDTQRARGIHHDVDDVDVMRVHLGADRVDLIGHSYVGVTVALYAMRFPAHTRRVVQIGPMAPGAPRDYPPHLTNQDGTLAATFAAIRDLEKERAHLDPVAFCRKFWSLLGVIYVVNPADANRVVWSRCELPNERGGMKYWMGSILPSIQALALTDDDVARATAPVLTIHGRQDRSSPYGAGRDWVTLLPNARLLTIDNAGHVPWIEAPDKTLGAVDTFLDGDWPDAAEQRTADTDTDTDTDS